MGKAADNTPIDGDKDIDGGIAVGMDTVVDMDVVVGMDVVVDTVQLVPVHEVAFGLVDTMVVDMEGKADIVVVEDIVDTVDIGSINGKMQKNRN